MYFVDEEHVVRLERGEQSGQVAGLVEHRAAGELEAHSQFVGNNVREGGLAQSGRAVEQGVIERLATIFGGFHKDAQVFYHVALAAEVVET